MAESGVNVKGLSPRMRGNLIFSSSRALAFGSIPAHAGEPPASPPRRTSERVYPRACGGTRSRGCAEAVLGGLSPRMRGNLKPAVEADSGPGSIPAHAGEPERVSGRWDSVRVYPRACGGTVDGLVFTSHDVGLSPRMRGNHRRLSPRARWRGSIPAHAGEPHSRNFTTASARVYPRACGGTGHCQPINDQMSGLSPRMRGNQHAAAGVRADAGSIPAHAGEPHEIHW